MTSDISAYLSYMYSYPHKTAYRRFVPPVAIAPFFKDISNKTGDLYFHIPFCSHKCGFCNLFSHPGINQEKISAYLDTLYRQAQQISELAHEVRFSSFAIGGGTPLILDESQTDQLFEAASLFGVDPHQVFTSIETSPEYSALPALRHIKNNGVKRLSIGIQSFHEHELKKIKRTTTPDLCHKALERIQSVAFPQLNIDLIYGIEGQTVDSFLKSIHTALTYQPSELFLYPLYVREGTGIMEKADNTEYHRMYETARKELCGMGFVQTSMRRFVKQDTPAAEFSCGDEVMISCGCGGRSYIGDLHYSGPYAVRPKRIAQIIDDYIQTTDFTSAENGYILDADEKKRRFIIKNLMYHRGIDKGEYLRRFDENIILQDFDQLVRDGYVRNEGDRLILSESGLACSDYIGQLFISPTVRKRMTSYEEQ